MESERSLQRKQATYTSIVTTLLPFCFTQFLAPSTSVLPPLPSVWLLRNRGKHKKEDRSLTLANYRWFLNFQPLVAILMVSQYPDGYSITVLTYYYYSFVILSLELLIAGRAI